MSSSPVLRIPYQDIIEKQATINIITLGHVAHGKSTLVRDMTGVRTQKHKSELERNITIHLGYANAKIWECPETGYLCSTPSSARECRHPTTNHLMKLRRHISFVDAPGHESLMSTMISGTQNIDVVFLLIAGNDQVIPQPQTYEHLLAISNIQEDLQHLIILQNKLDLIEKPAALENLRKIQNFLEGSPAEKAPILPISAQMNTNIDCLYEYLFKMVSDSCLGDADRYNLPAVLTIIRSFNVNKANIPIEKLVGGIVGGSLHQGYLKVGDLIEIRPGIISRGSNGWAVQPLISEVVSLGSEKNKMEIAVSGGLIGVGLEIDPGLTKNNRLTGHLLGHLGTLPGVYEKLVIKYHRINRTVKKKKKLEVGEKLKLCVQSNSVIGRVLGMEVVKVSQKAEEMEVKGWMIELEKPICCSAEDPLTILRHLEGKWKLDGRGDILEMTPVPKIIYPDDYAELCGEFQQQHPRLEIVGDSDGLNGEGDEDGEGDGEGGEDGKRDEGWSIDYHQLLEKIPFRTLHKNKINLPIPTIVNSNRQVILNNFQEYVACLTFYQGEAESSIPAAWVCSMERHLIKYLSDELQTSCHLNGEKKLVINGRFSAPQLEKLLGKYIREYLICKNCQMMNSFLYKKVGLVHQNCNYCNSIRVLS